MGCRSPLPAAGIHDDPKSSRFTRDLSRHWIFIRADGATERRQAAAVSPKRAGGYAKRRYLAPFWMLGPLVQARLRSRLLA